MSVRESSSNERGQVLDVMAVVTLELSELESLEGGSNSGCAGVLQVMAVATLERSELASLGRGLGTRAGIEAVVNRASSEDGSC